MTAINKKRCLTISIFFLILFFLPAQESDLRIGQKYKEADRLIENYDYNGAINLLVEIVKENPEEMDKAQKMIQEIRKKKEEFNAKYEELIRILFEENDYQKGLEIIEELEELDKNPNDATAESLTDARISAELIYFRLLFNDLMDRALVQIENNNFDSAVTIYITGFQLHKRTYDERNYGEVIKGPVDSELSLLLSSLDEFVSSYNKLDSYSPESMVSSVEQNRIIHDSMLNDFSLFTSLRNNIWKAGYVFEEQNKLLSRISDEFKEDFFLSFANRIVFGRLDNRFQEGIVLAMDQFWQDKITLIQEEYIRKTDELITSAETFFDRASWLQAQESFDEAEYWAEKGIQLSSLWSGRINLDTNYKVYPGSKPWMNSEYITLENFRIKKNKAEYQSRLSLFNLRLEDYQNYDDQNLELMAVQRDTIARELNDLIPLREEWNRYIDSYKSDVLYNDNLAAQQGALYLSKIEDGIENYRNLDGKIALDSADFEILPMEREYSQIRTSMNRSLQLLNGIQPENAEEGDVTILYVYPEESASIISQLIEENEDLTSRVSAYKSHYQEIQREIPQKENMAAYIGRAEALLLNMEDDLKEYIRQQRKADQNIASSQRFLGEGEFRLEQSEQALSNREFRQAVQELTTAQDLFVQALSFNETVVDREEIDRRIADLQDRILQEENKEVIRYVRENVNEGKSLYLQGLYGQSEVVLLRAESRWYTTNADPNNEINYWLNLVRAALSVESGRTIEETEPLYAEMTQFLNHAFTNFELGKARIEGGNRSEGLRYLDKADQNLNEILIPMPLNQQASVLKLKIQQLKDPELFKITFDEKFKSSLSKLRTETDIAYIDLKDLSAIQPDYPGMSKALYDAEIILGIRNPPPDLRALAESEDLYNRAYAIVEGNVRSQFPVALSQLDRAIVLNPENQDAITLKDRIQLDAGGQTTAVLTSAANARFKSAEEKYINGEYFEAYAIVQQLLNDQKTASYPPLQDLKRRIESKF
ncbi:hypothetical protein EXM22_05620 [Oceanispirochaeta crateris]|uniref:Tetratricopeptide repeat protein n=1 Tax=Oceanispirochaeta crateris TaxID=2518645 RepID=A0A5C1QIR3_9SPIO|nr:hypothetical protein [Oceanispirochaeta crateris]QEN07491.1 hypothetical protein EXM22_05620 [Oceanispirochaeta crateris]